MIGLPSKLWILWRRLARRFELEDSPPTGLGASVDTSIQPVSDIDDLVADVTIEDQTLTSVVSAFVAGLVCPVNERWMVYRIDCSRQGGDRTADQFGVFSAAADLIRFPSVSASAALLSENDMVPFWLQDGMYIGMNFSSAGSTDGGWTMRALVRKYTI